MGAKRSFRETFAAVTATRELVVQGGFSRVPHVLPTHRHEGDTFAKVKQYDDWLVKVICGGTRKNASLAQNTVWKEMLLQMRRDPQANAAEREHDPFADAVGIGHAQAGKRSKRQPRRAGPLHVISVSVPTDAEPLGPKVRLLCGVGCGDKELWIHEEDLAEFLLLLAEGERTKRGQESLEQDELRLGHSVWLSGESTWCIRWIDEAGSMQKESLRVSKRSNRREFKGDPLSPDSFLVAKARTRSRIRKMAKVRGCVMAPSSSDSDEADAAAAAGA